MVILYAPVCHIDDTAAQTKLSGHKCVCTNADCVRVFQCNWFLNTRPPTNLKMFSEYLRLFNAATRGNSKLKCSPHHPAPSAGSPQRCAESPPGLNGRTRSPAPLCRTAAGEICFSFTNSTWGVCGGGGGGVTYSCLDVCLKEALC